MQTLRTRWKFLENGIMLASFVGKDVFPLRRRELRNCVSTIPKSCKYLCCAEDDIGLILFCFYSRDIGLEIRTQKHLYFYIHKQTLQSTPRRCLITEHRTMTQGGRQQDSECLIKFKGLDGEREVLELFYGERAVVRLTACLAREVTGAPILALVARNRQVHLTIREIDNAKADPATGTIALDVVDVVHVDDLAVAACRGAERSQRH